MAYYKKRKNEPDEEHVRVILPNKNKGEVFGYIERKAGAYRMYVRCADGKVRMCRIPGAKRRRMWIRENDLVIIKPWELEEDTKGDIVHLYTKGQEANLRGRGFLKAFETEI
ncbi:translation initiation factor 1A [archaeon CG10_big_fil_rev_8_21_14_0_10_43_11]|nr:MAG: translation initiation factor 1A [archaeon CG10_big_fil_rev_8_21_14_0_10_43_11]